MAISVLGALTAPLVAVAALGTLDGFGKLLINLPRIIEYQFRYANRIMQRGNGCQPTEAIDVLRIKLDESKEYRFNALKLFVKYDTDEDGKLSIDDLNRCLKNEFPQGVTDGMISSLVDAMDSDKDSQIDCYEFLSAVSGSSKNADKLLQEARESQLDSAYEECKKLTSEYAKTFFLATLAMEPLQAKATWAIYAWCRRVDEIVDGPKADPNPETQRKLLEEWMARLDSMWSDRGGQAGLDSFDLAFKDMLQQYPGSDIEPYRDMIRGMQMDIDDRRYETWEELYLYCYRVAATVGLMTLPVMGTAKGVGVDDARTPAVALGIALQITNILRDVGEDARDRGRIYLPIEDLKRFGVTEESIFERSRNGGAVDENYRNLMKFEIARARQYYKEAEEGIALLAPGAQLPVAVAAELYKGILDELEKNDYDNFNKRAFLSREQKLLAVPPLWLKTITGGWEKERKEVEDKERAQAEV